MLRDSLYKIDSLDTEHGVISVVIEINKDHTVFAGHFPGQPVLPGACMLQMIKEVLEQALAKSIRLKKAEMIKFLMVVDPQVNNLLQLKLTYRKDGDNMMNVAASLSQTEACLKFKGTFIIL